MNPGQSVKDRAGKWMILEAEKRRRPQTRRLGGRKADRGKYHRHRVWAVVARRARVYRTIDRDSGNPEARKRRTCCGCAAPSWSKFPALPYSNPKPIPSHVGKRLARPSCARASPNGVLFRPISGNNLDNCQSALRNRPARKSGRQTGGKVDGFHLLGRAPGGTLGRGPADTWKEKKQGYRHRLRGIRVGRPMYEFVSKHAQAKATPGGFDHRRPSGLGASRRSSSRARGGRCLP